MSKGILGILAALMVTGASSGCSSHTMQDTQTIHNREATRIWIVRRKKGMTTHDAVVFCDVSMMQSGRELCVSWEDR